MKMFARGEVPRVAVIGPSPNPHREWKYDRGSSLRIWQLAGARLDWWNLYDVEPGKWSSKDAALAAYDWRIDDDEYDLLVLLGGKVRDAFGLKKASWLAALENIGATHLGLVMPHPSGLNRWWNDAENREAAQVALREAIRACS